MKLSNNVLILAMFILIILVIIFAKIDGKELISNFISGFFGYIAKDVVDNQS